MEIERQLPESKSSQVDSAVPKLCRTLEKLGDLLKKKKIVLLGFPPEFYVLISTGGGLGIRIFKSSSGDSKVQQQQETLTQLILASSPCTPLVRLGGSSKVPGICPLHPSYLVIVSRHLL